ncbi:hypothetical protein D3C80_566830 [compost metagenome]
MAPTATATKAPRRISSSQPNRAARLNIRQAMAMGAMRMTRLISFIITSNRPSMDCCRRSVAGLLVMTRPTPKNRAKTMTGRIWFSAAAVKTFDGISSRKKSPAWTEVGALPTMDAAPARPWSSNCCARAGSTPSPGRKTLTMVMPISTATAEMTTVNNRLLAPARPRAFRSPISATPMTRAEKSKGSTSMNSRRRKICPTGPVTLEVSHWTQAASPPMVRLTRRPPPRPIRNPISISI